MGLKERMKFFNLFLISNSGLERWASHYDAQDTPVPSRRLCYLYSILHNQLPRNADPSNACLTREILAGDDEMCDLSTSSQAYLCLSRADIQREGVYGLCSQRLSKCGYFRNRISESEDLDIAVVYRLSVRDNGILSPKQGEHSTDLLYVNYDDNPYSKGKNFIQTESCRNEIAGF